MNHQPKPQIVRNFSLPTYNPNSSRIMSKRYYANALKSDDHAALMRGDQNHNHKLWTPKDRQVYETSRRELLPQDMSVGSGGSARPIPLIIVTSGQDARTHAWQRDQLLQSRRQGIAPPSRSASSRDLDHELHCVLQQAASMAGSSQSVTINVDRDLCHLPEQKLAAGAEDDAQPVNDSSSQQLVRKHQIVRKPLPKSVLIRKRASKGQ
ncbi:hypothetical protein E8E13_003226 [Curvularia kusanoi]|uniref:Uncharacterized protein n=1 Tax=Curvularia kusanoi TaxID=90978 RepID=A0A9P4T4W3_CURKU|nr:hypothetical protein E8E13_003226 [Curvularia kusanoi]